MIRLELRRIFSSWRFRLLILVLLIDSLLLISDEYLKQLYNKLETASRNTERTLEAITPFAIMQRISVCDFRPFSIYCEDEATPCLNSLGGPSDTNEALNSARRSDGPTPERIDELAHRLQSEEGKNIFLHEQLKSDLFEPFRPDKPSIGSHKFEDLYSSDPAFNKSWGNLPDIGDPPNSNNSWIRPHKHDRLPPALHWVAPGLLEGSPLPSLKDDGLLPGASKPLLPEPQKQDRYDLLDDPTSHHLRELVKSAGFNVRESGTAEADTHEPEWQSIWKWVWSLPSCETAIYAKKQLAERDDNVRAFQKVVLFGWVGGAYDGVSKVLSTSILNVIFVVPPLALCIALVFLFTRSYHSDNFVNNSLLRGLKGFTGVLIAGIVSFILQWTFYGFVFVFAAAIGFLLWFQAYLYTGVELCVKGKHVYDDWKHLRGAMRVVGTVEHLAHK